MVYDMHMYFMNVNDLYQYLFPLVEHGFNSTYPKFSIVTHLITHTYEIIPACSPNTHLLTTKLSIFANLYILFCEISTHVFRLLSSLLGLSFLIGF